MGACCSNPPARQGYEHVAEEKAEQSLSQSWEFVYVTKHVTSPPVLERIPRRGKQLSQSERVLDPWALYHAVVVGGFIGLCRPRCGKDVNPVLYAWQKIQKENAMLSRGHHDLSTCGKFLSDVLDGVGTWEDEILEKLEKILKDGYEDLDFGDDQMKLLIEFILGDLHLRAKLQGLRENRRWRFIGVGQGIGEVTEEELFHDEMEMYHELHLRYGDLPEIEKIKAQKRANIDEFQRRGIARFADE